MKDKKQVHIIDLIEKFKSTDKVAHVCRNGTLTYSDLSRKSEALAHFIISRLGKDKSPIVIIGHKQHLMLISFLACIKSGHPYVPIDIMMPFERIQSIIDDINPKLIINVNNISLPKHEGILLNYEDTQKITNNYCDVSLDKAYRIKDLDILYIIYTSGSTGAPKGVQVTLANLNSFLRWILDISKLDENSVVMNQASFSFDLSIMDVYLTLTIGATLVSIDKELILNSKELLKLFKDTCITTWSSTPSFIEMCLANKYFNQTEIPSLKRMFFCGEVLSVGCVKKIFNRFPQIGITNLYGPTETTVAVTSIDISKEMCEEFKVLPVGFAKDECEIFIQKSSDKDETGEIVITGESVGYGYYNDFKMTNKRFVNFNRNNQSSRGYLTGDEGFIKDNILFFIGRKDEQIKLNGYRIELGDIEYNLKMIDIVTNSAVIPIVKNGKVDYLVAFVVVDLRETSTKIENISLFLRNKLRELIPEYMIPRKIIVKDRIPLNINGKIDRKLLLEEFSNVTS